MKYLSLLLSQRNYLLLWIAHVISEAGDWLSFIAITILVYRITDSGLAVSGIFVARIIPSLFLAPIAGVIVDKWNRKFILVVSDIVRGVLILTLLIVHELPYVYVVIGLSAVADLFFQPARSALIPNLVEKQNLMIANAFISLSSDALSIIGPAVAAVFVAWIGIPTIFGLDAISFWISAVMLLAMNIKFGQSSKPSKVTPFMIKQEWAETLSFIKQQRFVFLLIIISAIIMLGGGALNALLVVFANEHLGFRDSGFGWLVSALGMGFVAGSLLVGITGNRFSKRFLLSVSLLTLSLVPILWAFSYNLLLALSIAVINGIANSVFNIASKTFFQLYVPDDKRGKVFTLAEQFITVTSLFSMVIAGWLSDVVGVRMVFMVAALCIFPAFVLSLMCPLKVDNKSRKSKEGAQKVMIIFSGVS